MTMQFMITAKAGYTRGSAWVVDQKALTIGRSYRCDIVVDDGTVSRQHCRVIKELDGIRLEDLGSRNPALVEGVPEKDAVLQVGDEFSVGRAVFLVTAVAAASNGQDGERPDSETISIELDNLGLDSIEQHGAWPGTTSDYILLFRFCRVCSHIRSEAFLLRQIADLMTQRFGASAAHILVEEAGEWPVATVLGKDYASLIQPDALDKAVEQRRAFSTAVPRDDLDARYLFLAPLYHGDEVLGLAVVKMEKIKKDADRETVLTFFSNLCGLVGPCVHAARHHESLLQLNKRLSTGEVDEQMPLVGRSPLMKSLRNLVYEAARTPLNVIITGETGTGKELIAEAIHRNSERADKPFIVVNCAAIPSNMLESELFGHERGAFTGAHIARRGLLTLADGGTLFLDEVGDLSPENQARILRVLEQGTFRPVGATAEEHVDVRFVAATNRPVDDQEFRSDLYHRLAGFTLHAPPLRNRIGDIPGLAQHFMDVMAVDDERLVHVLSEDAVEVLKGHNWPGNVRQLRNAVERIAHRTRTALISAEDIWRDGHIQPPKTVHEGPLSSLAEMEREHIMKVLRKCSGNRAKSARVLGISRSTLYLKLAEYGVSD